MAEALGLAASVLQLADAGFRLSVKLYTVSKQVKNAPQIYAALSQEVSFTSTVLKQLGDHLKEDGTAKAHNQKSLDVIGDLRIECETIYGHIDAIVTFTPKPDAGRTAATLSEWRHRLSLPYKEKEIGEYQAKLERMKLLLNVMLSSLSLAVLGKGNQNQ